MENKVMRNTTNIIAHRQNLEAKLKDTTEMKPVNRAARRAIKSKRQPIKGGKK
jgi:hypothetical protein